MQIPVLPDRSPGFVSPLGVPPPMTQGLGHPITLVASSPACQGSSPTGRIPACTMGSAQRGRKQQDEALGAV